MVHRRVREDVLGRASLHDAWPDGRGETGRAPEEREHRRHHGQDRGAAGGVPTIGLRRLRGDADKGVEICGRRMAGDETGS